MTQRVKRAERLRRQKERFRAQGGYVPSPIRYEHKLCACGHASYEVATRCCVCQADLRNTPRSPGEANAVNRRSPTSATNGPPLLEEANRLDLNPQEAVELLDHMEEQERYAHLVPDGECRCECHSCEIDDSHHGPGEGDCQKAYVPKPVS